ncbi:transposase, partial [Bradyrhizobium sp. 182]|nr:transposase [Bradyrhizobium sp. 182]
MKKAPTRCSASRSSPGRAGVGGWSTDAKAAIVAESFAPGASVSALARRHDISPS